ncbi:MAG: hypothetical protein E6I49_09125 [Chloroflexi bacterium]|nr:MAG: hypothetical protein E6I49_09125 [Chloroflexota bacterium]
MARASRARGNADNGRLPHRGRTAQHREMVGAFADAAGSGRGGPTPAADSTAGRGRGVPDRAYHVRGAQAHPHRSRVTFDDLPTLRAVPTVTAAQMAEVDRITAQDLHIPVEILMEDASRQIAVAARAFLGGSVSGKRIVGLVGTGNNGGDTAGALRHLIGWGARVAAEVAAPQERAHEITRVQIGRLLLVTASPVAVVHYASQSGTRDLEARAAATVTLALPKTGLLRPEASPYVGTLLLADVGIPHAAFSRIGVNTSRLFERGDLVRILPP